MHHNSNMCLYDTFCEDNTSSRETEKPTGLIYSARHQKQIIDKYNANKKAGLQNTVLPYCRMTT